MNYEENFWDKQAARFEKQSNKDDVEFTKIIKDIVHHLKKDDKVLDYACGIGTSSIKMSDHVKEIYAIDISSRMIEVARRRASTQNKRNINFEQLVIFDPKLEKGSYNVITAFNILHLLPDLDNVISKIYELLIPGGLFISSTPCLGESGTFMRWTFKMIGKLTKIHHMKLLRFEELRQMIEENNFADKDSKQLYKPTARFLTVQKKN